MSSISTLLIRNLEDVFGENDPVRRRAAVDEIFTEDCVFYEPGGTYRGRDEIHRIAGAIKATHPDFRYLPIVPPEEWANGGRIQWVSGRPGEVPEDPRGPTSSLPGTAGLPPCISFSTSDPELDDTRSRTSPTPPSGTLYEKDRAFFLSVTGHQSLDLDVRTASNALLRSIEVSR